MMIRVWEAMRTTTRPLEWGDASDFMVARATKSLAFLLKCISVSKEATGW